MYREKEEAGKRLKFVNSNSLMGNMLFSAKHDGEIQGKTFIFLMRDIKS